MERRVVGVHEVREAHAGDKMTVKGYAALYNSLSKDLGGFVERIIPGAFKRVLATNPDVVMLFNHNADIVLGRTTSGTLRLREDERGLAFECDLPDTTAGRDVYESVKRGDLNGCSFAFKLGEGMDSFAEELVEEEGVVRRTVKKIVRTIKDFAGLFDASIVTNPAYGGTTVAARGLVVAAEVRSHVEALKKPTQLNSKESLDSVRKKYADNVASKRRKRDLLDQVL